MTHMFDQILSVCGICAEAICLTCFLMTGAMRTLPSMFWFLIYTVVSEIVGYAFYTAGNMRSYWLCYVVISVVGYLFELAVGWELAVRSAGVVVPVRATEAEGYQHLSGRGLQGADALADRARGDVQLPGGRLEGAVRGDRHQRVELGGIKVHQPS